MTYSFFSELVSDRDDYTIRFKLFRMLNAINPKKRNGELISMNIIFIDEKISSYIDFYFTNAYYFYALVMINLKCSLKEQLKNLVFRDGKHPSLPTRRLRVRVTKGVKRGGSSQGGQKNIYIFSFCYRKRDKLLNFTLPYLSRK